MHVYIYVLVYARTSADAASAPVRPPGRRAR